MAAQNPISFASPQDYQVQKGPNSVAVGDFNQDGRPDIAAANFYSNCISILLQNTDGTFKSAVNYTTGNSPVALTIGDFNHDGKLDLLVINQGDSTISVLLGNGDGTFQTPKVTAIAGIIGLSPIAVEDFNSDGNLDIALLVPTPQVGVDAVAVLIGNGDGTFAAATNYTVTGKPEVIGSGDFNSDGKLDLVVLSTVGNIEEFVGNGDGTFQAVTSTPNGTIPSQPFSMVVADFNHDGKLDLAVGQVSGPVSTLIFLGNGDGSFQSPITLPSSGQPLVAADLNGDGNQDLIVGNLGQGGQLQVLLNSGDGTFMLGQIFPNLTGPVALADFNGDGKLDLVEGISGTANTAEGPTITDIVSVVFGNGDGTFQINDNNPVPNEITAIATADFNGDGKIDLAMGDVLFSHADAEFSLIGLLLNNGSGFAAPSLTELQSPGIFQTFSIAAGDFNADGKVDLAVAGPSQIAIALGNGDGTFQPDVSYGLGMTGPIAVGDFNNDGKLDIIGSLQGNSDLSVLLGNGDGTFGFPLNSPTPFVVDALAVGDFNNDGNLDVAALVNNAGNLSSAQALQLYVFFGDGHGMFSGGMFYNAGPSPFAVAAGDMNGDGKTDLIVSNNISSSGAVPSGVAVLLNNGSGIFGAPIITNYGNSIDPPIAVADFNLDGKLDVAIGNTNWGDVSIFEGNGDGTLQPTANLGLSGSGPLVVGDFNGDGSPDLAVISSSNSAGSSISVLLNKVSGPAGIASPSLISFGNQVIGQTSSAQTITLKNSGSATLHISNIQLTGPQSAEFSQTNTCTATLAAGSQCTVNVQFTPPATGLYKAEIQITDNAFNSPQIININGAGVTPASGATLSASTVGFGNEFLGLSGTQSIKLSSTGNIPLTLSSIALSGANATDFSTSNDCFSSLSIGSFCTITINFSPTLVGTRTANLVISDDAANTPQMVAISGVGVASDVGLQLQSGSPSTISVAAGGTATYMLSIGGHGISGTTSLTCTGAPASVSCSVPASENVSATTTTNFSVTITTTARTSGSLRDEHNRSAIWTLATLGFFGIILPVTKNKKRLFGSVPIIILFFLCSCGGGNNNGGGQPQPSGNNGTPAGSYPLTITATMGTNTQSTVLTLNVQ